MPKKWLHPATADRRAIELYRQLKAIEELQLVEIDLSGDSKSIILADKTRRRYWREWTVDQILSFDVQQAKDNGGTYDALSKSLRRATKQMTHAEAEEEVHHFLSGDE